MASRETRGNFGKSRTGRTIKRKITITSPSRGKRKVKYTYRTPSGKKSSKSFSSKKEAEAELQKATIREAITPKSGTRRVVQNGVIYNVGSDGGFVRTGFTNQEASRRERIKSGTATARDIFDGVDVSKREDQLKVLGRISPKLRQQQRVLAQRNRQATERGRALLMSDAERKRLSQEGRSLLAKPERVTVTGLLSLYKSDPTLSISQLKAKYESLTGLKVPKGVSERARANLDVLKERAVSQRKVAVQQAERSPIGSRNYGKANLLALGEFGLGVASGYVSIGSSVLRPQKTLTDLKQFGSLFIKNPIKVTTTLAKSMKDEFVLNPAYTLGEYVSFNKAFNSVAKATTKSAFGRAISKEIYILNLPKELRKPVRTLINSAESQRLLNPVPKNAIKDASFFGVKELTRVEAKALAKTLKKTDSVVFGTASARTLSKGKTRLPNDVDLATANPKKFIKEFINNIPKKQRKDYKLKGAKLYRNGKDIMDIKDFTKLYPQKSLFRKKGQLPVSGYVLRLDRKSGSYLPTLKRKGISNAFEISTSPVVKVKGINFAGFGEQTTRKTLGTLQVLLEKNVRRKKDIADLLEALEVQIKALKKSKTKNPFIKLRNKRAIKNMEEAVKLLKSKKFKALIGEKLSKKPKSRGVSKAKNTKKEVKKTSSKKKPTRSTKSRSKKKTTKSKLPKSKLPKSRLVKSRLAKSRLAKSRLGKSKLSKSRLGKSKLSKSRLSKSRTPSSKLAKSRLSSSKTPSSRTPRSRLGSSKLGNSKLGKSRLGSSRTPTSKVPPTEILKTKLPKLKFDSKRLENRILTFKGSFRERRNPKRKAGKSNPIVTKTINLRDTKNRALQRVAKRVDNSLSASLTLKVVGVGKAKKDIKKPALLSKFRTKKSLSGPALRLVEKNKFRFDKKGEKLESGRRFKKRQSK